MVAGLVGCGSDDGSLTSTTDSSSDDSSSDDSDSSGDSYSGTEVTGDDADLSGDNSSVAWAEGGTDAMTLEYPNPFDLGYSSTCDVTANLTEGPCYSDTVEREDISEGRDGLPARLCFRVLDSSCNPVEGVVVDIWHCDTAGIYSGDGMRSVNFCTGGDSEYTSNDFFRGTQTTDEDGVVWFNTCFPGWYSSRAVHIHFKLILDGSTEVTSQVGFADSLVDDILTSQSDYSSRGEPDTYNSSDTVFPSSGYESYLMDTYKMSDGSLLAWKQVRVS